MNTAAAIASPPNDGPLVDSSPLDPHRPVDDRHTAWGRV